MLYAINNDMKEAVLSYIEEYATKVKKLFLLFIGYGGVDKDGHGLLCFTDGNKGIRETMAEILSTFKKMNPTEPDSKLRIIFAQCYGHLADDGKGNNTVQEKHGMEYVYITDAKHP